MAPKISNAEVDIDAKGKAPQNTVSTYDQYPDGASTPATGSTNKQPETQQQDPKLHNETANPPSMTLPDQATSSNQAQQAPGLSQALPFTLTKFGPGLPSPPYDYYGIDTYNNLVTVVKDNRLSLHTYTHSSGSRNAITRHVDLATGLRVRCIACSKDGEVVAILRDRKYVELMEVTKGTVFLLAPKRKLSAVLGFVWVFSSACDFVLITNAGIELYRHCKLSMVHVDSKRHSVTWYQYSHDTRVLLLGVGDGGYLIQPYQFIRDGMVKLPQFNLSEDFTSACARDKPRRADISRIKLVRLYTRVYCCHVVPTSLNAHRTSAETQSGQASGRSSVGQVPVSTVVGLQREDDENSGVFYASDCTEDSLAGDGNGGAKTDGVGGGDDNTLTYLFFRRFFVDLVTLERKLVVEDGRVGLSVVDNVLVIHMLKKSMSMVYGVDISTTHMFSVTSKIANSGEQAGQREPADTNSTQNQAGDNSLLQRVADTADEMEGTELGDLSVKVTGQANESDEAKQPANNEAAEQAGSPDTLPLVNHAKEQSQPAVVSSLAGDSIPQSPSAPLAQVLSGRHHQTDHKPAPVSIFSLPPAHLYSLIYLPANAAFCPLTGTVYALQFCLRGVVLGLGDVEFRTKFLARRRNGTRNGDNPRSLLIETLIEAVSSDVSAAKQKRIFDCVCSLYAEYEKGAQGDNVVNHVSPHDIALRVFQHCYQTNAVAPASLHASLCLYCAAITHYLNQNHIPVPLLLLELNLKLRLYGSASISTVIYSQPHFHTYTVAVHLVHLYERNLLPQGKLLATYIYKQLVTSTPDKVEALQRKALHSFCELALQGEDCGSVLTAVKCAGMTRGGIESVGADKFVTAAEQVGSAAVRSAVCRVVQKSVGSVRRVQ